MDTLMIGLFQEHAEAELAITQLMHAGFSREAMSVFYVNPQGQHALHPIGGDEDESPGTHEASSGAATGALKGGGTGALLGALTLPLLGPAGAVLGAAVGAYGGALVGALNKMEEPEAAVAETAVAENSAVANVSRGAGILLAVAVATPAKREEALEILREHAQEIEEATGELRNGDWIDFDPLRPKKLIF
ncbi:MAG: hypothetical protein GZ085_11990 [Sulfuriferula multivorans]|uniref:Glycine zipper domain-containing protein n=1 Tax=Sulfuriferula multivorans TaxID=1559896 RepID=A0A7C9TB09_9PROT|nr:hypothetical protein [Sulfuriferula multivorans]